MKFSHLFGQSDSQQKYDLQDENSQTVINSIGQTGKTFPCELFSTYNMKFKFSCNKIILLLYALMQPFYVFCKNLKKMSTCMSIVWTRKQS